MFDRFKAPFREAGLTGRKDCPIFNRSAKVCTLCGKPFNETMIVEDTDAQSLRDEVTMLRGELKEVLKGYNELTRLGVQLTKEIHELKTGA